MDVTLDSDLLQQLASRLSSMFGQKVAPATSAAFDTSAMLVRDKWQRWAMGETVDGIPNIKTPSGRLAHSIKIKRIGPFDAEIYSDSPHAQRIQDGTPELDMKTTHPYGAKSRVSKEGFPYLIVPFKWGTPNKQGGKRAHMGNFIPALLYKNEISKMGKSKRTGYVDAKTNEIVGHVHTEPNYAGQDVIRDEYAWSKEDGRHKGDGDMNGMVRIGNDNGKGSTYFTFRVISALQLVTAPHSWIRKAIPAIDVVGAVESETRPLVEELIQAGLEADFGI
jgi:hypothetical protein